jgi:predicted PurR-regulated permease PerM
MLARAVPLITDQGLALFGYVSNALLLPLVLFYLVRDWRRFTAPMAELIPRRWFVELDRLGGEIDSMLGQFLRGQLAVMVIMAAVYGCGLWAVGLESGFAIGVVAGLLVFIPYVGAAIGLLLATLAAVLQFGSLSGLLLVWLVFVLGQLLESMIITPKLVGERIGLHPLVVIFALMAFGQLFGFVGIMLALPISAVLVVLVRLGRLRYLDSRFYRRQRRTTPQGR